MLIKMLVLVELYDKIPREVLYLHSVAVSISTAGIIIASKKM